MMQALPGLGRPIQCRTADNIVEPREVDVDWERGGLFVHRTAVTEGRSIRFRSQHWSVSHAESGLALLQDIGGLQQAIDAAEALLGALDWTRSAALLRADPRAVQVREQVGKQFGGVW